MNFIAATFEGALSDRGSLELLQTLNATLGQGLRTSYAICDAEGQIIYSYADQDPGLSDPFVKGEDVHPDILKACLRALQATDDTSDASVRSVPLIPGCARFLVAPIPGKHSQASFLVSGPFLLRRPSPEQMEKAVRRFSLLSSDTFAIYASQVPLHKASEFRRISEHLRCIAAVTRQLIRGEVRVRKGLSALSALQFISVFINSSLSVDIVLRRVLDSTISLLNARNGSLMLLDESTRELRILVAHGLSEEIIASTRVKMGEGISGWVAQEGVPRLMLKGVAAGTDRQNGRKLKGSICVPMIAKDQVIGVLNISDPKSGDNFDHDDLNMAAALASQAAIAIENSKLYNRLRRKLEEMSAIFKIGTDINSSLDRTEVLQGVMDQSISLLQARTGSLMLLNDETRELYIEVANGLSREVVEKVRVPVGEGIAGKVVEDGRPRLLRKGVKEAGASDSASQRELKAALSVPLNVKDRTIGVVNVSDRLSGGDFTDEELELLTMLANQAAIAIENSRLHAELQELFISSITALANAIDARDPYTRGHSERVSRYSVRIGERLGLEGPDLELLRYAALLHDVGKIHIKDDILQKPGKLTDDEFQKMKLHPVFGAEIIRPIRAFQKILPFIFYHHERFCALGGYPHGISGTQIPLEARIITVADSYDAMTSTRPYRKAMPIGEAVKELNRWRGTQFDPHVVDVFLQIIEEDPDFAQIGIFASNEAEKSGWIPAWGETSTAPG